MTDTYTPTNFDPTYGWGAGYPTTWGTAPTTTPSPSWLPPTAAAATTAANAGVPPGLATQQQLQAAYGPPAAAQMPSTGLPAAQQQVGGNLLSQLTPQQLQLLQYFLGGRSNTAQGQQQLLMQLLRQRGMLGQQQPGVSM